MLPIRLLLLDVAPFWFVERSTTHPTLGLASSSGLSLSESLGRRLSSELARLSRDDAYFDNKLYFASN
jgi:hypothetical protein